MVYGDAGLKETRDIEQKTVISKMHSMQWLKSNSQLFGHSKVFPHGNQDKINSLKEDIDQAVGGSIEILSSTSLAHDLNLEQSLSSVSKDNSEGGSVSGVGRKLDPDPSNCEIQSTMEAVWNKDLPDELFPDTQSLVLQRLDEEEMMSMALAKSIVTAGLENFRIDGDSEDTSREIERDKENTDTWHSAENNSEMMSTISKQENPKQCHDSNNNNAKSDDISEIGVEIVKRQAQRDWTNEQADSTDESSGTIKNSPDAKDCTVPTDTCENDDGRGSESDRSKSSPEENSTTGKVESVRSKQAIVRKTHVSSSNVTIAKNKSITEEKQTEGENSRRCHKVQVTRTQSYNTQYIRDKALARSQSRYSRTITKSDQDLSKKPAVPGASTNPGSSSSSMENRQRYNSSRVLPTRDGFHRRYDQDEPRKRETEQQPHNTSCRPMTGSYGQPASAQMRNSTRTFEGPSSNRFERNSSYSGNRLVQNCSSGKGALPNPKTFTERYDRDNNGNGQRLKRDVNVFRRSTDYSSSRYQNVKPKIDEHRPTSFGVDKVGRGDREADKNAGPSSLDSGANRMNETTSLESARVADNFQQQPSQEVAEARSPEQPATKIFEIAGSKPRHDQEIANCHTKATPTESSTVKYCENMQEMNVASHNIPAYLSNPPPVNNRQSMNPFLDSSQNIAHINSMQQVECLQNLPMEQLFDNTLSYSHMSPINLHTSEEQQAQGQKDGQLIQSQSSGCMAQQMQNLSMAGGGLIHYQNHPGLYMNQYNPVHNNMLRKSTEQANHLSQSPSLANNSLSSACTQNLMMPADTTNLMMHGNQAGVVLPPPPGFQNHPQQEQWPIPQPDMLYFGNVMSAMHPLGIPMQNLRQPCATDYNALQQAAGYLQQPVIYVPPMCMQTWNPMIQCPGAGSGQLVPPNSHYPGYNPVNHQVMPPASLIEPVSCPVSSSAHSHQQYKSYQQGGESDYRKEPPSPPKMLPDASSGAGSASASCSASGSASASVNYQGSHTKLANTKAKDNPVDPYMRASQYYKVPNEYQNTPQDAQLASPYTYSAPVIPPSSMKACPLNVHSQIYHKYPLPRNLPTGNYPRYSDNPNFNNREYTRMDDMSKNESDSIPPMVSPMECMYYGINYSRKTDYIPSPTLKSDIKH